MVNPHNGKLLDSKKESSSDTRYYTDKLGNHCAKFQKADTRPRLVQVHVYEMSREANLQRQKAQ